MKFLRSALPIFVLLMCMPLLAGDTSAAPPISEQSRMQLVRGLNAELVFVRRPFPMGQKGLTIKDGKVTPSDEEVARMIAGYGPSVKPGDRARITAIAFKGRDRIVFEINGGPVKKKKWYQRITVGGTGGTVTPGDLGTNENANFRGTLVTLEFDKYVPEMSIQQVKGLLQPVLDFNAKSAAEAYLDTVPPKVKEAIKNHQVLVGMNREMVTYALGRPPKKYRDRDGNTEYEEWIYGEPPKDVQFVRFVGDQVVRLEIMKVDGEKIVRTQPEFDVKATQAQQEAKKEEQAPRPANAPTLRRPGEAAPGEGPFGGGTDKPSGNRPPPPN